MVAFLQFLLSFLRSHFRFCSFKSIRIMLTFDFFFFFSSFFARQKLHFNYHRRNISTASRHLHEGNQSDGRRSTRASKQNKYVHVRTFFPSSFFFLLHTHNIWTFNTSDAGHDFVCSNSTFKTRRAFCPAFQSTFHSLFRFRRPQ